MRKKRTAILPLYLAGMILLAFTVFPHHHHNNYICFNVSHCEKADGKHNHQHDSGREESGCISHLFQTQIHGNSSRNIFSENHEHIPFHHFLFSCYMLTETVGFYILEVESACFPKAPDENFRILLLTADKASRAPPIC